MKNNFNMINTFMLKYVLDRNHRKMIMDLDTYPNEFGLGYIEY